MHNLIGLPDKLLHNGKLLLAVLRHKKPPMLRDDGQILKAPLLIARVILLGLRLPENVAKEPGDNALSSHQAAFPALHRPLQAFGQFAPHAGLLGNI